MDFKREMNSRVFWSLVFLTVLTAISLTLVCRSLYQEHRGPYRNCQAQLKDLQIALSLYREDYGGINGSATSSGAWKYALKGWMPRGTYPMDFICPQAEGLKRNGFELNSLLSGIRDSEVKHPKGVVFVWDSISNRADSSSVCRNTASRHSGGLHALFYDGHVQWLRATDPQFNCSTKGP